MFWPFKRLHFNLLIDRKCVQCRPHGAQCARASPCMDAECVVGPRPFKNLAPHSVLRSERHLLLHL